MHVLQGEKRNSQYASERNEAEEARLKRREADCIAHEKGGANEFEAYKECIEAQRDTQSQTS